MEKKNVNLYYWKIRGLGSPVANLLEYLNVPYNYNQYDFADRPKWIEDKNKLIEGGFTNANLPYIQEESTGFQLSETFAVLYYLATKHNPELAPKTTDEITQAFVVKGIIQDYNTAITSTTYQSKDTEDLKKKLASSLQYHSTKTNHWKVTLAKQKWVLGEKLSFLDFYLVELLEKLVTMQAELKTNFVDEESLKVFQNYVNQFNNLEAIKKYRESDRFFARPYNVSIAPWV